MTCPGKTFFQLQLPAIYKLSASSISGNLLRHGFISLADASTVAYLVSSPFSPTEEFEINPLDPVIGIEWGLLVGELLLSPKDEAAPTLAERVGEGKLP